MPCLQAASLATQVEDAVTLDGGKTFLGVARQHLDEARRPGPCRSELGLGLAVALQVTAAGDGTPRMSPFRGQLRETLRSTAESPSRVEGLAGTE